MIAATLLLDMKNQRMTTGIMIKFYEIETDGSITGDRTSTETHWVAASSYEDAATFVADEVTSITEVDIRRMRDESPGLANLIDDTKVSGWICCDQF